MERYDKRAVFEREVKPLIQKIKLICEENEIPMFMTYATANNGVRTEYSSEILSPTVENTVLRDDKITKHALVMNGFDVVPSFTNPRYMDIES